MVLPAAATGARADPRLDTPIDYPDNVEHAQTLSFARIAAFADGRIDGGDPPCLLQLTAFFLPTIAGVNATAAAEGLSPAGQRRTVLTTALLFVLGFTIPYTAGGALMGGIGERLAKSNLLDQEGPIVVGAGLVMILMAGVVAYRARAPLICKHPNAWRLCPPPAVAAADAVH